MTAYYNENDPRAASWLRELINADAIAPGDVDERDIRDVRPADLEPYQQCHFFAGIGGWSLALRLAGWPDDRPVWTGSCPCQPFSAGGRGAGFADERHLWPSWFHLISQRQPPVIFGEQVSRVEGLAWWDLVHSDLQMVGYASAAEDICAACIGAYHIRQRLFWVAHTGRSRLEVQRKQQTRHQRPTTQRSGSAVWSDCLWIPCQDGKTRPIEPGTLPLVDGLPGRVGLVRGYGNAIVPWLAANFIEIFSEFENRQIIHSTV